MGFFDRLNARGGVDTGNRDSLFDSGLGTDASDTYANGNKLFIEFYHLPSDKSVAFKGFITEWTDKFDSKYNSEEVYGRNDPIHTFQGTSREISVSWEVPAASGMEAQENLARVSLLAQFLYPSYNVQQMDFGRVTPGGGTTNLIPLKVGTMSKAPLIKVRFANLIMDSKNGVVSSPNAKTGGLLCAMTGLTITADLEAGVIDSEGVATPKSFKLSTTLRVLHQHSLGWAMKQGESRPTWMGSSEGAESFPYNAWGRGAVGAGAQASTTSPTPSPNPSGASPPGGTTGIPGTGGGGTGTP